LGNAEVDAAAPNEIITEKPHLQTKLMKHSIARLLLLAAALMALLTISAAGYWLWSRPSHLRVAAGPQSGADAKLMVAFNRMLDVTKAGVRLDVVPTDGVHANNLLLEKGEVDMAVVRLDDPLPIKAGLVAVLRTNVLVVVAPARLKLDSLSDVKGRRIGLVSRSSLDAPVFLKILDALGIKPTDVNLDIISAGEVSGLTRNGRVDVVAIIGAPSDPEIQAAVNSVARTRKDSLTVLSVDLGDVDKSTAAGSSETIGKHAFPRLGIPDDEVDTVGVKTALVAASAATGPLRERIYNNAIEELTRSLIERHGELAREVPIASLITAPDKDDDARYPIHPGTSAYVDDTDTSWATLFTDQVWNIVLVGGAVSSALAAAGSFLRKGALDPLREVLGRLNDITERAESSTDPADAAALSRELRDLSIEMTNLSYERGSSYEQFAPLQLAWENAREAIATLRAGSPLRASDAREQDAARSAQEEAAREQG
jgi:TRAP-type uncharacterized transport system substrate-binding protein